jgi:hypothetical protein
VASRIIEDVKENQEAKEVGERRDVPRVLG